MRIKPCSCGSGLLWEPYYDARGIFLTFVCDDCRPAKLAPYRKEVLTDKNYSHDEPIDEE